MFESPLNEIDSKAAVSEHGNANVQKSIILKGTQRLNFVISDALVDRIKMVQKETGSATITEVLKNALRLYIAAVLAHKRGEILVFRSAQPGGQERPIDIAAGIY